MCAGLGPGEPVSGDSVSPVAWALVPHTEAETQMWVVPLSSWPHREHGQAMQLWLHPELGSEPGDPHPPGESWHMPVRGPDSPSGTARASCGWCLSWACLCEWWAPFLWARVSVTGVQSPLTCAPFLCCTSALSFYHRGQWWP